MTDSSNSDSGDKSNSYKTRASVESLASRPSAQVLVIGGGINGVSVFRDLALQGVDVALVERNDFCSGASGASSHMIHGGIRYLENGEFRLVSESVDERNDLLKTAPHYVKPLETTIPIFTTFSGVVSGALGFFKRRKAKRTERGAALIKVGLTVYDAFSRRRGSVPRHRFVGRTTALREMPMLHPGIRYAATYFDASVHNPERLTLDVLSSGLEANPSARASNYLSVHSMGPEGIFLRDEITGEDIPFDAEVVVNVTGAWVDETNAASGLPTAYMGGTKGSHIVLDDPTLLKACAGREVFFEHTDGRIVLIYPIGERVLVGTTDIATSEEDPVGEAVCTEEEIDYFFDLISHVFPAITVDRSMIVYSFSGVRPLPSQENLEPGLISRDYRLERNVEKTPEGTQAIISVIGGKWTTFRALGAQIADEVLPMVKVSRKANTQGLPIGGGWNYPTANGAETTWVEQHLSGGISPSRATLLFERYGTRAPEVLSYLQRHNDQLFTSTPELSTAEVKYMIEHEQALHLADILQRRTDLTFTGEVTLAVLEELAAVMATYLQWSDSFKKAQLNTTRDVLSQRHHVRL
ncbi:glycerol-3-phosphate dehydrogenase/oxidase [Nesterenkonia salmonea]|uniref:Glycerol-3-phosphate dehydrogenase/oxidase n=1 Tax=Nesterenkonia salmonea TaxID=1804987 RepID=A0A5R9B958_9MICC|nr:glycerol-3-phosphate dehydrogenase/oxidase [Nesterenkonia salmonea]